MKRVTPSLRNESFVRMSAILIGLTAIVPGCASTAKESVTVSVVVKGNEIVFVGSTAGAQKLIGKTPKSQTWADA